MYFKLISRKMLPLELESPDATVFSCTTHPRVWEFSLWLQVCTKLKGPWRPPQLASLAQKTLKAQKQFTYKWTSWWHSGIGGGLEWCQWGTRQCREDCEGKQTLQLVRIVQDRAPRDEGREKAQVGGGWAVLWQLQQQNHSGDCGGRQCGCAKVRVPK